MGKDCDCDHHDNHDKSKGAYAQLSSDINQDADCHARKVKFNLQDAIENVGHDVCKPEKIVIKKSGAYFVVAAPQVGTTNKYCPSYADFWMRVNKKDIDNSNVRVQFSSGADKDVIVGQAILELKKGDCLNIMMSGSDGTFIEAIKPSEEPLIPSIIFSLYKIA